MIGAVMAGFDMTQRIAKVAMLMPASTATLRTASTVSNSRSCQ